MIRTTLVLESRTSGKNFNAKSMSFYDFSNVDSMIFTMSCKELVLIHINYETNESRTMVVDGTRFFNSLEVRTHNKKPIIVYRY